MINKNSEIYITGGEYTKKTKKRKQNLFEGSTNFLLEKKRNYEFELDAFTLNNKQDRFNISNRMNNDEIADNDFDIFEKNLKKIKFN